MYHVIDLKQTRGIKNVTLKAAKKIVGVVQKGIMGPRRSKRGAWGLGMRIRQVALFREQRM